MIAQLYINILVGSTVAANAPPAEMIVRECEVCLKVFTTMYFRNKDYIADKFIIQSGKEFESKCVTQSTVSGV